MKKLLAAALAWFLASVQISFAMPIITSCPDAANLSTSVTLTGVANLTWWVSGYQFSAGAATAAGSVNGTITNLLVPGDPAAGAVTTNVTVNSGTTVTVMLPSPIPTYQPGVNVVATLPAVGSGSAHASCAIFAELR